jgi:hypothetical protein
VATAIAYASADDAVRVLADGRPTVRRVATLVAKQAPRREVFAGLAEEIGRLLGVDSVEMVRYDGDRVAVVMAGWATLTQAVSIGTACRSKAGT